MYFDVTQTVYTLILHRPYIRWYYRDPCANELSDTTNWSYIRSI